MEENPKNPKFEEPVPESPAVADDPDAAPQEGQATDHVDLSRAASILESLLLVSEHPLSLEKAGHLLGNLSRASVREVVAILQAKYAADTSGIVVDEVAKGVQFRTNPANQEYVRQLFDIRPARFSRAALETLSIVAYKQPVTRLEVEQIRGVDCAGSLKTLMERRLVKVVGKKDVIGRPFLFGTSREFLEVFGLGSLSDLPSMHDIEEFLTAATGGVVAEHPAEAFVPAAESELAASLYAAEHGEPLLTSDPGLPEGVSDDVLSEAASRMEGGEGDAH
ncbi:MAG: SMC-Scp complex subunit ScpB [Actinobacteria bacterium]|nr:SMC-Scp complex subunit ScpB [Actinomycetota bacterium]MBM2828282.1 SMC-Scp complex subunit ScpB [Actinomycetota bacterium]